MWIFDIQRFGGKGGSTTNVQSYQPSEYELQLQSAAADYADAVSPNALWLNNEARKVLQDSLGTVQVDYDSLNQQAQDITNRGITEMYDTLGGNTDALNIAQNVLGNAYGQIPGVTNNYVDATNDIIDSNTEAARDTNGELKNISRAYGDVADNANTRLERVANTGEGAARLANAQIADLLNQSSGALDKYSDIRDSLIRGELPSPYQQNMQDVIENSIRGTMGQGLNSLANRGILNSSVTQGVLNNIEKNATEAMANRYLDNINTINSLLGSQSGDALSLLNQQANLIGQQYGNTGNALDRTMNVYNTQTGNSMNALNQQGNLAQQQLNNINTANQTNANLYNQQYANQMNSIGQQASMGNQYLQNQLATQAQNAATLDNIMGHATDNITTAAAAQEAAQQPASNLWNMSLGLGNSNTGALAAAAGKGTTTTTTSKSGGGGLFSGLMGGLFG